MLHDILVQVYIVWFLVSYISFGLSRIFKIKSGTFVKAL